MAFAGKPRLPSALQRDGMTPLFLSRVENWLGDYGVSIFPRWTCCSSASHARKAAAAAAAISASTTKKAAWLIAVHSIPTTPPSKLPAKLARNQAATVVALSPGGATTVAAWFLA